MMLRDDVLRAAADNDVRFIRLWFTDVLGFLKSVEITRDELPRALTDGKGFDGSSVEGYARIHESDVLAVPDPSTFTVLPWDGNASGRVARMFCDIRHPDGRAFGGDPRGALRRMVGRADEMGFVFKVGVELEFFYLQNQRGVDLLDQGGYFDLTPLDVASHLRRDTVFALEDVGIPVEVSHHEVAPSQHEIDLHYADALVMADHTMTARLAIKQVALHNNTYATFMPKPVTGHNGSGMHVHQSLFRGEHNVFFDASDPYQISQTARRYVAGLLHHAREISIILAQWVNSYKRLVPGFEAPVYLSWGRRNRSALVRIPSYKPENENATRVEVRGADPACNPYLVFAVMLAAGLDGIHRGYDLPAPIEEDIFAMTPASRRQCDILALPGSLGEAVALAEHSELLVDALGQHIFDKFIESKRIEWDQYRSQVSDYEIARYLPVL